MDTKMVVCCLCHIYLAPFDTEKVEVDGRFYHRKCIKTKVPNAVTNAHVGEKKPRQTYFRFKEAQ